jgi:hypothetical protein
VGQNRGKVRVLICDLGGSENKFKLDIAVGKLMAILFCYIEGKLLVEFGAMCADVKDVTLSLFRVFDK